MSDVSFADLPKDTLLAVCDALRGDGHTIWKAEKFDGLLPPEYLETVVHEHTSDGSHKGSIFTHDGDMLVSTRGVYGLTLYRRIASDLGLPSSEAMGRGFEAQDLSRRIREHLTS